MQKMVLILWWGKNSAMRLAVTVFLWVLAVMLLQRTQNTHVQNSDIQIPKLGAERCDELEGDWVPYEGEPLYNKSCSFILDSHNCIKKGRPDSAFLHLRWKPRACNLPRFDPLLFLETMRDKNLAFVGDSLSRNHFQSLMCMLSSVSVEHATLVYHKEDLKTQKWLFPSYNFTASLIWSPFLAKTLIPNDVSDAPPSEVDIHLDKLDRSWTEHYETWDYTIISCGKWYNRSSMYYENDTIIVCHDCPKRNFTELELEYAYRRVVKSVFDYTIESNHTGSVFYRTTSPDHSEWGSFGLRWLDMTLRDVEIEEFGKAYARARASQNGVKLRLLDVNKMSLLRPDGHLRLYTPNYKLNVKKVTRDCLHWHLPGPIDSWNDVLMQMINI